MRSKKNNERGASLVEYTLLAALIAIVTLGSVDALGTRLAEQTNEAANTIYNEVGCSGIWDEVNKTCKAGPKL